jgi:hypothetical protein
MPIPAGVTGARVRVTTSGLESRQHTGSVLRVSSDSLVLVDTIYTHSVDLGPAELRTALAQSHIHSIEVPVGRAVGTGALVGALIGGVGLGAIAYLGTRDAGNVKTVNTANDALGAIAVGEARALITPMAAVLGAAAGALIGALAAPEHWRVVYTTP